MKRYRRHAGKKYHLKQIIIVMLLLVLGVVFVQTASYALTTREKSLC